MANSDQIADSLENLSLDSQAMTKKGPETVNKDFYGDNGPYMYQQTYGYMPYGAYSVPSSPLPAMGHDGQLHALQEYHYPSPYYQPPFQTSQANASQVDVSTSGLGDQATLSTETNKGNSSTIPNGGGLSGNNGSGSLKSAFKSSSLNPNASYKTGNLSQGSQDPRFSYDGIQSTIPWVDMSISSNGQSKHAANSGFSSYTDNVSSGRNQNLQHFPHVMNLHNARSSSGVAQAYGYMNHMYHNNITYDHYGNAMRGGSGLGSYGYGAWKKELGWYSVGYNNKSKGCGYGKENMDGLSELNKGPRVKGYKNPDGLGHATVAVEELNIALTETNKDNSFSLIPDISQFNKEDFPESYSDAKFFVIKSYSEDDVHKSIKYNVWASTSTGNKKLDAAFHEAKEKPDSCPVFLLFSVNTSGQFVGVAEMVGPVDFNKTVEYWQQDKWTGCFPLKWHIIKDVPNTSLRHITLENNENKPVTNSRDTQEVNFEQGVQILKIFKDHSSKTCILDDFEFYEARQKIIQEKKAKHQLSQKQVSSGEPNGDAVTDNKENTSMTNKNLEKSVEAALMEEPTVQSTDDLAKANGNVKPTEENGTIAATEGDDTTKAVHDVGSAC
ncbi:evolutionarily conserved C-terminal region 2 [Hibiscus trionum]|uniref:YTH domain-containing family protein n=1 Tax=Hibiscus trionum TaxID=183268 RepID=A0A9W7HXS6_HIBTR|nr:evolutionarily conserved C-terminal region 2 [Hibiscus trionum]